jgi:hypothetical protein
MAAEAQSGFVPASPEEKQQAAASGFVPASPEDKQDAAASGFVPASAQDRQDAGGPSVVQQGLDALAMKPQARGFIKGVERTAATMIDQASKRYLGDEPTQERSLTATMGRTDPLAATTQMLPEAVKAPIRKGAGKVAAWLEKNTHPEGLFEWGGNIGEMVSEIMAMGPEAETGGLGGSGVGRELTGQVMSYADKVAERARNTKLLAENPTVARLVDAGIKYAKLSAQGAAGAGTEGTAQTMAKTNDPKAALEGGVINAAVGAVAEPVVEALQYVKNLRAGKAAAGPREIPPRPVEAPPFPKPTAPPEPPVEMPARMAEPGAVQEIPKPRQPRMAAPDELTPQPEMPEPFTRTRPAPVEPEDVGPAPTPPEPYEAGRAPAEQRLAEMEQQTARGAISAKLGGKIEDIGDPEAAAESLRTLNEHIDSEEFQSLPADQQADILRDRDELMQRADPDTHPPTVLDNVNDMGSAADAMSAKAKEAYDAWNDASGGKFVKLNNELSKLRGKFDVDSLKRKAEVENELNSLARTGKIGTDIERAMFRGRFADAAVLRDADAAISKAFKGAERSGGLNPQSLQTNWKNFVNGRGAMRVRSVLGPERYEAINNFVNDMAGEKAADAAANEALMTQHKQNMAAYLDRVKNAKTIAEAKTAAQDAQFASEKLAYDTEKAAAEQGIRKAKLQDRLNTRRRIQQHQAAMSEWTKQVQDIDNLNDAKRIAQREQRRLYSENVEARKQAELKASEIREQGKEAYQEAKDAVGRKNAAQELEDAQRLHEWRQQKEAIEAENKQLGNKKQRDFTSLSRGVWNFLKENAPAVYVGGKLASMAGLPANEAATVAGAAWAAKRILTNPTALKIIAAGTKTGLRPEVLIPVISSLIASSEPEPQPAKPQERQTKK